MADAAEEHDLADGDGEAPVDGVALGDVADEAAVAHRRLGGRFAEDGDGSPLSGLSTPSMSFMRVDFCPRRWGR